jgi:hypothetical protein
MHAAQELRDTVDQQAVAAVTAHFPDHTLIGGRQFFDPAWTLEKLPQDLDTRLLKLQDRFAQQHADQALNFSRYDDLRTRGIAALNDYDITIASQGQPVAALYQGLRLKTNHITYSNSALAALEAAILEITAAIELTRPQFDLF